LIHRAYYSDTIADFFARSDDEVIGRLARSSPFADDQQSKGAWEREVAILREVLAPYRGEGKLYLEFDVPRMGKRIDAVVVLRNVVFVLEFKVGATQHQPYAIDQVCDYALDLKHFHETSHKATLAPILIATEAKPRSFAVATTAHNDGLLLPIPACHATLGNAIEQVLAFASGPAIDPAAWEAGRYSPTPTIIEAATALYNRHGVEDLARSDAGAANLTRTSAALSRIIKAAQAGSHKAICFVTGVPGAGKTLVGLNVATQHSDKTDKLHSVYLSGNGPLVNILREALARDRAARERAAGRKHRLGDAREAIKAFIQPIHKFRDDCLIDPGPPFEHVVLFDEAQRAWNKTQTASFMKRKRDRENFSVSEPEFLISCMERHTDWAVVVCLVGGGQEINTGEAGIGEWVESVLRSFSGWHVHISPHLKDSEYAAEKVLTKLDGRPNVHKDPELHLSVSMRSFRAEHVSGFVKALLDQNVSEARRLLDQFRDKYPIVLTRDLAAAKAWLRGKARGTERYGLVVSSQAQRLKPVPVGIDVRVKPDPVQYFLAPKEDVRSSYYLEDAASEFDVQGLELDWTAVVWDGDFRHTGASEGGKGGWTHHEFRGTGWRRINQAERQAYLKNAYRVLLTRARQGMVVVVPEGDAADPTRADGFYDGTWRYLSELGLSVA
jgi:hypothetical protein